MVIDPKYGPLRRHQAKAVEIARKLARGQLLQKIVTAVATPGSGKSLMGAVFSDVLLDDGYCDLVIYIVPNTALQQQCQDAFSNSSRNLKRALSKEVKALEQGQLYERCGYVVTYQALAAKNGKTLRKLLRLMRGRRVVVILDEPHHLAEQIFADANETESAEKPEVERQWYESVRPVVEAAAVVLLMSGTLNRHDKQRIPFVTYDPETKLPIVDIEYDRRAALAEHAVLPIEFEIQNATAIWRKFGKLYQGELNDPTLSEAKQRAALQTALNTPEFVNEIVKAGVTHWQAFRKQRYRSRLLVIVKSIQSARDICDLLVREWNIDAKVATSDDVGAHATIRKFRSGAHEALVTVGMAYEGLDIPDLTHVIYLHIIRSFVWMAQAVERPARPDPKCGLSWEQQRAYVFGPDDGRMNAFVVQMRELQAEAYEERKKLERAGGDRTRKRGSATQPVSADPTEVGFLTDDGNSVRGQDASLVERVRGHFPYLAGEPIHRLMELGKLIDWSRIPSAAE